MSLLTDEFIPTITQFGMEGQTAFHNVDAVTFARLNFWEALASWAT